MEFDVKFGIITLNSIVFQKRHFVLGHPILAGWITLVRERERERKTRKKNPYNLLKSMGAGLTKWNTVWASTNVWFFTTID